MIKFVFPILYFSCLFQATRWKAMRKKLAPCDQNVRKIWISLEIKQTQLKGCSQAEFFCQARLIQQTSQKSELKLGLFSPTQFIYLTSLYKRVQPIRASPAYANKPIFIMLSLACLPNGTKLQLEFGLFTKWAEPSFELLTSFRLQP